MDIGSPVKPAASTKASFPFFFLRILIGGFFIAVGIDKVMSPYQNFLYVIQEYRIFPDLLEEMTAHIFPWIELFMGLFLFLGLWLRWTLRAYVIVIGMFILIILQALLRKLPIQYCGCFGGLFSSEIKHTLFLDVSLWVFLRLLQYRLERTSMWSLDQYFSKSEK